MTTSLPTRLSDTVGRARLRIKGDNSKRDLPYRMLMGAQTDGLGRGATDVGRYGDSDTD